MKELKKKITNNVEKAETNYIEATQAMIDIYYTIGLPPERAVERLILTIDMAIQTYNKEGDLQ